MATDFLHRDVLALRKRVFRLGIAVSHGLDEQGIREALDGEVNYVFWNPLARRLVGPLRDALSRNRERYVVATGPSFGWFAGSIRRRVESALRQLDTDYLDVLQLYWLGVSIHDRPRAARLAEDSVLDLLMIRYSAAHPGAERDVFPHLARRNPAVVAYTATAWRRLLRQPRGWGERPATAGECYRFCLTSPHVDVVLFSPANAGQLREDLAAAARGPLEAPEMDFMRRLGRAVHG